jgi:hypothetical protein
MNQNSSHHHTTKHTMAEVVINHQLMVLAATVAGQLDILWGVWLGVPLPLVPVLLAGLSPGGREEPCETYSWE